MTYWFGRNNSKFWVSGVSLMISIARVWEEARDTWRHWGKGYLKDLISLYLRVSKHIENVCGFEYEVGSNKEWCQKVTNTVQYEWDCCWGPPHLRRVWSRSTRRVNYVLYLLCLMFMSLTALAPQTPPYILSIWFFAVPFGGTSFLFFLDFFFYLSSLRVLMTWS